MLKNSILITVVLLLFVGTSLMAQVGFVKSYENFSNYGESLIDIVPLGDTILGIGLTQNNNTPYEYGLLLAAFDTLGNILYSNNLFLTTPSSCFFQPPSKIAPLRNGNFAITGGVLSSPSKIFYLEFDRYCNKINYFEYQDIDAVFFSSNNIIQIDSGFLILGTVNYLNDKKNDIFIKKIDNIGRETWTKSYGDTFKDEFFLSSKLISSNSILVCAEKNFHSTPSNLADWYKSWFFYIDTLGYVSSSWETNEDEKEVGAISLDIDSSNYFTYVSQTYALISGQAIRIFPLLVRRDSLFNLVWKRIIGEGTINAPNVFREIIPDKHDKGWIMVGEAAKFSSINAGYGEVCSWIRKVTFEGDSLWERKDTIYWSHQGTFENSSSGIFQTPNGDIYTCGYNTQYSPSVNVRATLVKVDRNGCIHKNCNLVNLVEPNPLEAIQVYPNPTTGKIEFSGVAYGRVSIYGINNNLIFDQTSNSPIDISTYPDGIYIIAIYDKQHFFHNKVLKISEK